MFRQLSQTICNCAIFPQQNLQQNFLNHSLQKFQLRKDKRSKRSLKFQSISRNKDASFLNNATKNNEIRNHFNVSEKPLSSIASITSIDNDHYVSQSFSRNLGRHMKENICANNDQDNFEIQKQNTKIMNQHKASFLPSSNSIKTKVKFNYQNEYQLLPPTNKRNKITSHTNQSQLSTTHITFPNISQVHKAQNEQKNISNHELDSQILNIDTSNVYDKFLNTSNSTIDIQSRPKTSNIIELPMLSEMMNQRQETESIYDGEEQKQDQMEYSRVLISCRKLMEENKNCFLKESAQIKLFDYEEKQKEFKNSQCSLFDQIKIEGK